MRLKDCRIAIPEEGPFYHRYLPVPVQFVGAVMLSRIVRVEDDRRLDYLFDSHLKRFLFYRDADGARWIDLI